MTKARRRAGPAHVQPLPHEKAGLTPELYAFYVEWLRNGFNGRQAWLSVYPDSTPAAADVSASRALRSAKAKVVIGDALADLWRGLQMEGEEVLARLASDARVDASLFYDKDWNLLPRDQWPEEFVGCVQAIVDGPRGPRVKLVNILEARRIIAQVTGKVKGVAEGFDALAAALRGDLAKHGEAQL